MNFLSSSHDNGGLLLDNHMSIQAAAEYSGYNLQLVCLGGRQSKGLRGLMQIYYVAIERARQSPNALQELFAKERI